jgi:hypothetical protein
VLILAVIEGCSGRTTKPQAPWQVVLTHRRFRNRSGERGDTSSAPAESRNRLAPFAVGQHRPEVWRRHRGGDSTALAVQPQRGTGSTNAARSPFWYDCRARQPGLTNRDRLWPTMLHRNDNGSLRVVDRAAAASLCCAGQQTEAAIVVAVLNRMMSAGRRDPSVADRSSHRNSGLGAISHRIEEVDQRPGDIRFGPGLTVCRLSPSHSGHSQQEGQSL